MDTRRWAPRQEYTKQEQWLAKRLVRTGKLFGFLRAHRHELFDESFQTELEIAYRDTGAGRSPVPPALLAMAVLLQAYEGASDAKAVELTVVDLRWQMVLDRLGQTEPAFSQGALCAFRHRLIAHDLDRRLLERTVELARSGQGFDWKKLPKTLRLAVDSSPLEGTGRVEDTINLLAHAARSVITCIAGLLDWSAEEVARIAGVPLLAKSSIKRALDREWSDPEQKAAAIVELVEHVDRLQAWIEKELPSHAAEPPLSEHLATLRQIVQQDLEPDPSGGGRPRIRQGVAEDRRVSIADRDMRHGRKSKSKRFNGYKRHIAADLDSSLILSCSVRPANRPEEEALPELVEDIRACGGDIGELHIDRGYIASDTVRDLMQRGGEVLCKPWVPRNGMLFTKADFKLDMRAMTITCPAGQTERIIPGAVVEFDPEVCARCPLRAQCTMAGEGVGRTVTIAEDERLQHRLRKLIASPQGRSRIRERVAIEHRLAHVGRKQGRRARYRGVRNNLFDLRRAAAVVNLETAQRYTTAA
jgi:Transposase DDE domain/Transposase domain (DUF772)